MKKQTTKGSKKQMEKTNRDSDRKYNIKDSSAMTSCSAFDCTGLIPSAPQNSSEIHSYEEMYPFLPKSVRVSDTPSEK